MPMHALGGTYVEGNYLQNKYEWKDTIGAWEERPGHFNDIWNYWSDDGIGYLEYLQDALDGIEFARGSPRSRWGSVRAAMGHPKPFDLKYVAVGNEDCGLFNYEGNYLKFHDAIRYAYPDIKIISNCDASTKPLNQPADLFDFHIYTNSNDMFSKSTQFDHTSRSGPKAFVSEYAVWREDAGNGSLLAAVAEAAFLIGLEKNRSHHTADKSKRKMPMHNSPYPFASALIMHLSQRNRIFSNCIMEHGYSSALNQDLNKVVANGKKSKSFDLKKFKETKFMSLQMEKLLKQLS
ncbi:hypothetical protein Fmac_029551 [Flemingia macrophylla]|uniref:Alpha-L-arabinofuranosidase 1 catalytic domain-containing protein n=1 Tax=Flemingia macrophylla TaxID=520843 RepID=A0ABD1LAN4_9FABA